MFGESAAFTIEDQSTYNGVSGTIISLLLTIVVLAYGLNRAFVVYKHGDTAFQTSVEGDNLNKTKIFSFEETQFNIAVGIYNRENAALSVRAEDYRQYFSFNAFVATQVDPNAFDM